MGDVSAATAAARTAKDRHVDICLTQPVESRRTNGFERWELLGDLPDFDFAEMDLSTELYGHRLSLPLFVSSMTGGGVRSEDLNRRLAEAAQATGIGMAVGSQSLLLKDPSTAPSYQVRRWAPDILLFADLGLAHLNNGLDRAACLRAVESIEADALMLYANHMHEAFQVAGDLDFSRLLDRLGELAADFPYPIVVKEVGNGFSEADARAVWRDCRWRGSTSPGWEARIGDGSRHWWPAGRSTRRRRSWACPPPTRSGWRCGVLPHTMPVLASGGVRNGVEVAKALALGARAVGMGLPFLKWAAESVDRVLAGVGELDRELRLSMWWAGARDVAALQGRVARRR